MSTNPALNPHLAPFEVVERLIGPPETVGPAIGISQKTGYGWRHASANRDAGDIPSARTMRNLLAYTAANGIPLKPEHLIWGAPAAEIDTLLEQMHQQAAPLAAAE
ncbi:MAG: hypothetical protein ACU0FT_08080 [Paracoccus sp. (in: a-proteobacteria)]|uniref:hypothetical protein n=1 Tax=Paracoccus sp. TaxID=267 RepID=UPI00405855BF